MCWLWHKWSKWEQRNQPMINIRSGRNYHETWESRKCSRCGKMQDREVKSW